MATNMLGRATSMGLIDRPPNFALSRLFDVISKGVTTKLIDPTARIPISVTYTGLTCIPPCLGGPVLGVNGLDASRYQTAVTAQSLFTGVSSAPFFFGIAGIVDYFLANVTLTDLLPATGAGGNGVMSPGALSYTSTDFFDEMESEAASEDIMVVNAAHLNGNPTIPDPTTGVPLSLGDLFVQAGILLQAIADQLSIEILNATQPLIPTTGATVIPPIVLATLTTLVT